LLKKFSKDRAAIFYQYIANLCDHLLPLAITEFIYRVRRTVNHFSTVGM